jgi:hypothetical protein
MTGADQRNPRRYRQPRRLNVVTISLLALLLIAGYVGYAAWPVISLNADVRSAMEDVLPKLYRANLLPDPESTVASDDARHALVERLTALGIVNADNVLTMTRNPNLVAIAVKLDTAIDLKLVGKKIPLTLNPRVETSAARVSY